MPTAPCGRTHGSRTRTIGSRWSRAYLRSGQTKRETHRLALRNENSTTLNLTISQYVKGLVHLVKANAFDEGAKQSFAVKGQYLAELQHATPTPGFDFRLVYGQDRERQVASIPI